jgi:flagellar basal-body rod modification protein FlgD
MSTSPVSAVTGATTASTTSAAAGNNGLTQADFLQLLTSEMENQDPLNPVSNDQYLAELAQFTSLQQTTDMSSTLTSMSNQMQQTAAMSYLGMQVSLTDSGGNPVSGVVSQVGNSGGVPYVIVNGTQYNASSITTAQYPSQATS